MPQNNPSQHENKNKNEQDIISSPVVPGASSTLEVRVLVRSARQSKGVYMCLSALHLCVANPGVHARSQQTQKDSKSVLIMKKVNMHELISK